MSRLNSSNSHRVELLLLLLLQLLLLLHLFHRLLLLHQFNHPLSISYIFDAIETTKETSTPSLCVSVSLCLSLSRVVSSLSLSSLSFSHVCSLKAFNHTVSLDVSPRSACPSADKVKGRITLALPCGHTDRPYTLLWTELNFFCP